MCRTAKNKAETYILPRVFGVILAEVVLVGLFAAVSLPEYAFLEILLAMLTLVVYSTNSSMTATLYLYLQLYLALQKVNLVGSWAQKAQWGQPWQLALITLQTVYSLLGAKWMLEAFNIFKYNSYT